MVRESAMAVTLDAASTDAAVTFFGSNQCTYIDCGLQQ
jgi:hypothetical protein